MNYSDYFVRLMTLEKRVAELTGRVYRLEHAREGAAASGTDDRFLSSVAPPAPVLNTASLPMMPPRFLESAGPTDDTNRSSVPLPPRKSPAGPDRRHKPIVCPTAGTFGPGAAFQRGMGGPVGRQPAEQDRRIRAGGGDRPAARLLLQVHGAGRARRRGARGRGGAARRGRVVRAPAAVPRPSPAVCWARVGPRSTSRCTPCGRWRRPA